MTDNFKTDRDYVARAELSQFLSEAYPTVRSYCMTFDLPKPVPYTPVNHVAPPSDCLARHGQLVYGVGNGGVELYISEDRHGFLDEYEYDLGDDVAQDVVPIEVWRMFIANIAARHAEEVAACPLFDEIRRLRAGARQGD